MVQEGAIPGLYNIVEKGKYEEVEFRMPVPAFLDRLEEGDVPEEVAVIGLGDAFRDPELIERLSDIMEKRANDLEHEGPMVQFVVDGALTWKEHDRWELSTDHEVYELRRVFGPDIRNKDAGWLVSPF